MPNWCRNELNISGPESDVIAFKEKAVGLPPWPEENEPPNLLNFHSLVPMPPELVEAGYNEAVYQWEKKNWGCKWGAGQPEIIDESPGRILYEFDTAWTPPVPLIANLAKQWPTLTFILSYDEPGMAFKGIAKAHGEKVEDHCVSL